MSPEEASEAVQFAALVLRGHLVSVGTDTVAALARDGWHDAHRALCHRAEELTKAGEPLPLDLQTYVVEAAKAHGGHRRVRGASPYRLFGRDICIKITIKHLVESGFAATRNDATEGESACSIVAEASKRIGIPMTEAAVIKVWEKALRDETA